MLTKIKCVGGTDNGIYAVSLPVCNGTHTRLKTE